MMPKENISVLQKKSPNSSFVTGFMMAFDIAGTIGHHQLNEELHRRNIRFQNLLKSVKLITIKDDAENISSDMENIGRDIRTAMRPFNE